jgi:hypothetical protein
MKFFSRKKDSTKVQGCRSCNIGLAHPRRHSSIDPVIGQYLEERFELECQVHSLRHDLHTHSIRSDNLHELGTLGSSDAEEIQVRKNRSRIHELCCSIAHLNMLIKTQALLVQSDHSLVSH